MASLPYVGGPEESAQGRETENKAIIAIAVEKNGRGLRRIRLRIEDVAAHSLLSFVQSAVTPGSTVHTDGWKSYAGPGKAGYQNPVTVIRVAQNRITKQCRGSTSGVAGQAMADRHTPGRCKVPGDWRVLYRDAFDWDSVRRQGDGRPWSKSR
jgi:transposase-like protein